MVDELCVYRSSDLVDHVFVNVPELLVRLIVGNDGRHRSLGNRGNMSRVGDRILKDGKRF